MQSQTFEPSDLISVLILIVLEGLLSGDNALVLAVMVMALPEAEQRKALRYGIMGAFILRIIATLLAVWLVKVKWVSLFGGLYLLYLPYKHFTDRSHDADGDGSGRSAALASGILGLTLFWSTVVRVELTDLVFAVDSILAAVAMTHGDPSKTWVVITGGILGIVMMRLLTLQVLELVKRYPKLIDGAYIVILWVGFKLIAEFLHGVHLIPFAIPKEVSIGVVIVLFVASFLYARKHADLRVSERVGEAEVLLDDPPPAAGPDGTRAEGNPPA